MIKEMRPTIKLAGPDDTRLTMHRLHVALRGSGHSTEQVKEVMDKIVVAKDYDDFIKRIMAVVEVE
jgi:hypothetical protein